MNSITPAEGETAWYTPRDKRTKTAIFHATGMTANQWPGCDWRLKGFHPSISLSLLPAFEAAATFFVQLGYIILPPTLRRPMEIRDKQCGPAQTGRATYCCHDTNSVKRPLKQQDNDMSRKEKKKKKKKDKRCTFFKPSHFCSALFQSEALFECFWERTETNRRREMKQH